MTLMYIETRPAYEPLDELLEEPTIRILRAIARLEWCTARELFTAIDIPTDDEGRYQQQIRRLCVRGELETRASRSILGDRLRMRGPGRLYDYRITNAGRVRLARELERANPERELAGRSEDDAGFLAQLATRERTSGKRRQARTRGISP
jgi:hypothetical protein